VSSWQVPKALSITGVASPGQGGNISSPTAIRCVVRPTLNACTNHARASQQQRPPSCVRALEENKICVTIICNKVLEQGEALLLPQLLYALSGEINSALQRSRKACIRVVTFLIELEKKKQGEWRQPRKWASAKVTLSCTIRASTATTTALAPSPSTANTE
jgi:hypothetical protein